MSSKIKDGLFMGAVDAAQDADFLQLNGIVHIINCVPRQVPNLFAQSLNVAYTVCELDEVLRKPFFDLKNREFMHLITLIDDALERTESVLVHSLNGIGRSPSLMIGFLMVKYCWGLDKAYDYMMTKRADIKPHESYIEQLCTLEAQLQATFPAKATEAQLYEWNPAMADPTSDELVLVHTYINCTSKNSHLKSTSDFSGRKKSTSGPRLTWIDQHPQLKKLHPALLLKPERPPNHSYNNMLPDNGWVDLSAPAASRLFTDQRKDVPRASMLSNDRLLFTDLSMNDADANLPESPAESLQLLKKSGRMHSFSLPKKKDPIEINENQLSLSSLSPSEPDELLEEVQVINAKQPSAQAVPRYLQQTRASSVYTGRPRKPVTRAAPSYRSAPSSSSVPTLRGSFKASTTRESEQVKASSRAPTAPQPQQPVRSSSATSRNTSTSGTNTTSSRVLFTTEFAPPTTKSSTNPVLRPSTAERELPTSTTSSRPRTAPPRTRKNPMDDMLQSKKLEFAASTSVPVGISRIVLEAPSRRVSASLDFSSSASNASRSGRFGSMTGAANASRRPVSRAQWK